MAHAATRLSITQANLFSTIRLYALLEISGMEDSVSVDDTEDPKFYNDCFQSYILLREGITEGLLLRPPTGIVLEYQLLGKGLGTKLNERLLVISWRSLSKLLDESAKIKETEKNQLRDALEAIFPRLERLLNNWRQVNGIEVARPVAAGGAGASVGTVAPAARPAPVATTSDGAARIEALETPTAGAGSPDGNHKVLLTTSPTHNSGRRKPCCCTDLWRALLGVNAEGTEGLLGSAAITPKGYGTGT